MLKVDWKLVEAKAQELYPRYAQGLTYSQLETELTQQGFDKDHINQITETLEKRYRTEQSKGFNIPLAVVSVVVALLFIIGVSFVFETGYIAIAAGAGVLVFVVARMILRNKGGYNKPRDRWK